MVGRRSTLAIPRIPSVPNRRGMAVSRPTAGEADGTHYGRADDGAGTEIVTVTLGGLAATRVVPAGRFAVTGTG